MNTMRIAFRVDASLMIGTGHVMRCLTLADALRACHVECHFICREHPANLLDFIRQRGHLVTALPVLQEDVPALGNNEPVHAHWLGAHWQADAEATSTIIAQQPVDWLVVDHYALDARWERVLRPHCRRLMVIDDLADRLHSCDLLLDQNLGSKKEDYRNLIPDSAVTLMGPTFALLRPEFAALRSFSLERRAQPQLQRLLITMGGIDKGNATELTLKALAECRLHDNLKIMVVMGAKAPWLRQVREQAAKMPYQTEVLVGVDNMAQLMADSDLAIGAVGSTSWERCCMGLPTLMQILADNQKGASQMLVRAGAGLVVDEVSLQSPHLQRLIESITQDAGVFSKYISNAAGITEGKGAGLICTYLISNAH